MNFEVSRLIELKNLGASSVNLLNTIGIHTPDDLRAVGSVKAYQRIRQRGAHVSMALLYALEGALLGISWQDIDPALKMQLAQTAERITQTEINHSAEERKRA